jgi:hypothetical protein
VLNGQVLVDSPQRMLPPVARLCGIHLDSEQWDWIIHHPSIHKYSKDQSRPYDADSRNQESAQLESCWGAEADSGQDWALRHGCADHESWTMENNAVIHVPVEAI